MSAQPFSSPRFPYSTGPVDEHEDVGLVARCAREDATIEATARCSPTPRTSATE